ncbi:hypothetical protein [Muricoccus roseus]|uniref:hypothetical protein n=1 Tax=Muricoccus roseus TaxID=198092 RepID=UPI001114FF9B|nr:hypothetical protein [Roseomonas rosea]
MNARVVLAALPHLYGRYARIVLALLLGTLGGASLNHDFYNSATSEIVALLALLMAGVLPTAILTATILRAGGLSVKKIGQVRDALLFQLRIWAALFGLSFSACGLLILGKLLNWSLDVPNLNVAGLTIDSFSLIPLLNAVVSSFLVLLILRSMTIFKGLRSLVVMSSEIAVSEAQIRVGGKFDRVEDTIEAAASRPGFGRQIDL